jgi:RNA polymerase sigma factor (sigma-70 family)
MTRTQAPAERTGFLRNKSNSKYYFRTTSASRPDWFAACHSEPVTIRRRFVQLHFVSTYTIDKPASLEAPDLMRECGKDQQNAELWEEFYSRFRRKILLYLLRAYRKLGGPFDEFVQYADDLVQDVFTKLVQNECRVVRSFRGTTELSVYAFLGSIAVSIVADQLRSQKAVRRSAQVVPLDEFQALSAAHADTDAQLSALLQVIDVERALRTDEESKNPERDLLIFKLHFVEGLSAREIASMPALKLTTSGLQKVLTRVRSRLVQK